MIVFFVSKELVIRSVLYLSFGSIYDILVVISGLLVCKTICIYVYLNVTANMSILRV